MKWKIHLIIHTALIMQLYAMFFAWWKKLLTTDDAPLIMSVIVFLIGAIATVLVFFQHNNTSINNKTLELTITITGSLLATAGAYMAFVPVMAIFTHSYTAVVILIAGVFMPSILPKLLPYSRLLKNA